MAKKKFVVWQDGSGNDLQTERYQSNGGLTYHDFLNKFGAQTPRGEVFEPATSNPDTLSEDEAVWGKSNSPPTSAQRLLIEAVDTLSPTQRKLWEMCMQTRQLSIARAAKEAGMSKGAAQTHLNRAKVKVTAYLRDHAVEL